MCWICGARSNVNPGFEATEPAKEAFAAATPGQANTVLPIYTTPQIANQLLNGYWSWSGSNANRWDVGNTDITFNVTSISAERATLARLAFATWSDVVNLTFTETTGAAELTFNDNDSGAYSSSSYTFSGGATWKITSSRINVEPNWEGGTSQVDSYTFGTFIHEIGHSLGLGHSGNYNGSATYGVDNHFQNDTRQYSVMSYMEQSYYGGASDRFNFSPQMADIYAAQTYYGAATTRVGNTTYGFNVSGLTGLTAQLYNFANFTEAPALTIYDSGGTDTLDVSGYSQNQLINLTSGSWSNIGGLVGNIGIYLTSVIENAVGGSGADTIYGNSANNLLSGGNGADSIYGGDGNDVLIGGAGLDLLSGGNGDDTIYYDAADTVSSITGGAGTDTLLMVTTTVPTSFNLVAQGFELAEVRLNDTGSNTWQTRSDFYDTSWRLDRAVLFNDNGTTQYGDYDQTSVQTWQQTWSVYDTLGRLDFQNFFYDNLTVSYGDFDQASTQTWQQVWTFYDTASRMDYQNFFYDNGTTAYGDYDQANANNWSQIWTVNDALGRLDFQNYFYDNGTRIFGDYDQASAFNWSQVWTALDNLGRTDYQTIRYDNLQTETVDYDQTNSYGWNEAHALYSSSGVLLSQWYV